MLILRDYQQDLVSKTFTAWSCGIRKVLLQLSTGGGKTIIFAAIASEFIAQGEGVFLCLFIASSLIFFDFLIQAGNGCLCNLLLITLIFRLM